MYSKFKILLSKKLLKLQKLNNNSKILFSDKYKITKIFTKFCTSFVKIKNTNKKEILK